MNTIIFDITTDGHHLEYLHHIYSLCANRHDSQYVFLVPERFIESSRNLVWSETDNVVYEFIESDDLEMYAKADGYISKQKILSGIINHCCEIGYAAQFGTPVIGPSSGLLGALIKKYELGVQFSSGTSTNLATAIRATLNASKRHTHSTYCESHSIDAFQNAIKSSL